LENAHAQANLRLKQFYSESITGARLTTGAQLRTYSFAGTRTTLRILLHGDGSDDDLRALIQSVWTARTDRYSEERASLIDESGHPRSGRKVEMYQIGG